MTHELHCYDYVNQTYEIVRRSVLADPKALFAAATSAGRASRLHVRFGALELGADIEVEIRGVTETRETFSRPTTEIAVAWKSPRGTALFPVMTATLKLYPLSPTETQVELSGTYDPPLGIVGEAIDTVALHRFAQEAVAGFVREIATYLRRTMPTAEAI